MKTLLKALLALSLLLSALSLTALSSLRPAPPSRSCAFALSFPDGSPDTLSLVYGRACSEAELQGAEPWEAEEDTTVTFVYTDTARLDSAGGATLSWEGPSPLCLLFVNGLRVEGPFEDGQAYELTTP